MAEVKNLVEGLTDEILRVTEIRNIYLNVPNNAGAFAAHLMQVAIDRAKEAQARGELTEMIAAFHALQEFEL